MDLSRYALLFQSEAREHLTELDGALLALERGAPPAEIPARLDALVALCDELVPIIAGIAHPPAP